MSFTFIDKSFLFWIEYSYMYPTDTCIILLIHVSLIHKGTCFCWIPWLITYALCASPTDCSAGADQAAKNDICGGPTKGFCVDSKTSKAACACFDAYEGPLCQSKI